MILVLFRFTVDNFVNKMDTNAIFTTEGHFLLLPHRYTDTNGSKSTQTCQNIHQVPFNSGPNIPQELRLMCEVFVGIKNDGVTETIQPIDPVEVMYESILNFLFYSNLPSFFVRLVIIFSIFNLLRRFNLIN